MIWQQTRLNFLSLSELKAVSTGSKLRKSSHFDLELAEQTPVFVWSHSPVQDGRYQTSALYELDAQWKEMDAAAVKTN